MDTLRNKEDLRIIKTKRALTEAFAAMLREAPFEKLTVNDLCTRAGVRRATFYKHFKDKNDFFVYLIKEERQNFEIKSWRAGRDFNKNFYTAYVCNIIDNLSSNVELVNNVLASSEKFLVITCMVNQNYEQTVEMFKHEQAEGKKLTASPENLAGMLIGGISVIIYNWCTYGMQQSAAELKEEISAIITSLLN